MMVNLNAVMTVLLIWGDVDERCSCVLLKYFANGRDKINVM